MKKQIILSLIIAGLAAMLTVNLALAGVGPEPPENAEILDIEIWGVVTLICKPNCDPGTPSTYAMVRVKRVVDCVVQTETKVITAYPSCCPNPANPELEIKDWALTGIQFFDMAANITPYIDKIKNFYQLTDANGDTVTTFDAKFKFYK